MQATFNYSHFKDTLKCILTFSQLEIMMMNKKLIMIIIEIKNNNNNINDNNNNNNFIKMILSTQSN